MKKFEIWLADLNPRIGTETGKTRPVLIVQSNLLNEVHNSTIICPITSRIRRANFLRVNVSEKRSGLERTSDIMIDQIRAIDNTRLIEKVGKLPSDLHSKVNEFLKIVIDLE